MGLLPLSTVYAIEAMELELSGKTDLAEACRVRAQEHLCWEERDATPLTPVGRTSDKSVTRRFAPIHQARQAKAERAFCIVGPYGVVVALCSRSMTSSSAAARSVATRSRSIAMPGERSAAPEASRRT